MKTVRIIRSVLLASLTTASVAFSPLPGQNANPNTTPDPSQDSKTSNSTADRNSSANGNTETPNGTMTQNNSKDNTQSLDKNPSTAPTDSGQQSGTKNSNDLDTAGTTRETSTQASASAQGDKDQSTLPTDREFLIKAAQGGMTEVELGKLAQEKASSPDVKQFGSRMVTDHSKADGDLKAVAAKEGVSVPSTLDARHQATVDRLQHLSGSAFDHAYVQTMVKDHEKDATEFRRESTSAQDPEVKTFAGNTLKVIESHLSDIKSIQSNMSQNSTK